MNIEQLVTEAKTLVQKHHDGTLTLAEGERMAAVSAELKAARDAKAAAGPTDAEREEGERFLRALSGSGRKSGNEDGRGYITKDGIRATARNLAEKMKANTDAFQAKALAVGNYDGSLTVSNTATLGQQTTSLMEAVPTVVFPDRFISYLRQTSRALNAGVVAPGAVKPTSTIGLERVQDETRVVAHLSEPVDEMLLTDVPSVSEVLSNELLYGLYRAVEDQFLTGAGGTAELAGVLNATGVQVLAEGGRPIDRLRTALTRLQVLGYTAGVIGLHPTDWEAIETATTTGGDYVLGSSPVDLANRTLWGVPVVLTVGLAPNTGVVLDPAQVALAHTQPLEVKVGQPGDLFTRNQVQFRVEGRFQTMLRQAAAVVKVILTDPAV